MREVPESLSSPIDKKVLAAFKNVAPDRLAAQKLYDSVMRARDYAFTLDVPEGQYLKLSP